MASCSTTASSSRQAMLALSRQTRSVARVQTRCLSTTPQAEFEFNFRNIADRVRGVGKPAKSAEPGQEEEKPQQESLASRLSNRAQRLMQIGKKADPSSSSPSSSSQAQTTRRIVGGKDNIYLKSKQQSSPSSSSAPEYIGLDASGEDLFTEREKETLDERTDNLVARLQQRTQQRSLRKKWNAPLEHKYSTAVFRISPQKLQDLADQINKKPIDHAILQMQFSSKKAAQRIKSSLCLARDHAIAKGLDRSRMIVSEVWVNKGDNLGTKYLNIMGRGRFGIAHHPKASMHLVLRQGKSREEDEMKQLEKAKRLARSIGTGGVARTSRPMVASRPAWGY